MAVYVPLHEVPLQFQDGNGDPLASGTLEFFQSGTSTPTNLFSDNAGTSVGSSITLNASGYPESGGNVITLFRDTSVALKIIGKNSAGTTLWTADGLIDLQTLLGSTATGEGASLVGIEDSGGNFTATNVEDALAEIREDLASTSTGKGASDVGVEDSGGLYSGTTVEAVLAELGGSLADTFTGTPTGGTSPAAQSIQYRVVNGIVTLKCPLACVVTSTSTEFTITGLPSALQPTTAVFAPTIITDGNVAPTNYQPALAFIQPSSGTITFYVDNPFSSTGFANDSNPKGWPAGASCSYSLT